MVTKNLKLREQRALLEKVKGFRNFRNYNIINKSSEAIQDL